ncbi:Phospholipid-transporting ATPase 1 [Hordeum vulgare]|nr:Phospholipid-transporting ATPase 1 [Hordeum vulgare]
MQDQVGLDGFPLNHEFLEDCGLEKEDEDMDIDGEPLFEEELANQTVVVAKPKRKSKRMKAYTSVEDKLLCECWRDVGQDPKRVIEQECNKFCATYESIKAHPMSGLDMQDMVFQALETFKVQHDNKDFHLSHYWTIIKGEEKFKGKTNSKKGDKRDVASITFLEKVEGMISKKDLREEKHQQEKEDKMNAFMEIQRRRLKMDAERQAKMLELEEAKQAKMLEIEATNVKTKVKEVALASMKTGVEIMKVDLNTISLRKRLWFEKMQDEILKFD